MPDWTIPYRRGTGMEEFRRAATRLMMLRDWISELIEIRQGAIQTTAQHLQRFRVSGSFWKGLKWGRWKATKNCENNRSKDLNFFWETLSSSQFSFCSVTASFDCQLRQSVAQVFELSAFSDLPRFIQLTKEKKVIKQIVSNFKLKNFL